MAIGIRILKRRVLWQVREVAADVANADRWVVERCHVQIAEMHTAQERRPDVMLHATGFNAAFQLRQEGARCAALVIRAEVVDVKTSVLTIPVVNTLGVTA